ncbi:MAG: carbon-nitrogen hydrolase family protein [archaeon]|nr:carbon-nitrogen hydrolase family protein [archaeon]
MKVALIQSRGLLQDPTVNFFKARMRINNVDADMFIFPEMFCSGYSGRKEDMKIEMLDSKIITKLCDLSVSRGCAIICGCPIKEKEKIYDCALLISGKEITVYKKMILGNDGAFDENQYFTPGNQPMIIDHMGLQIGLSVGNDLLLPELYKFYAENGVDIIVCISAFNANQMNKFDKIVISRAAENSLPVIVCNMVGSDCGQNLIGKSKFIGPDGSIIESCTESSDVRILNIDTGILRTSSKNRKILPSVKFGECIKAKSISSGGTGPVICPFFDG